MFDKAKDFKRLGSVSSNKKNFYARITKYDALAKKESIVCGPARRTKSDAKTDLNQLRDAAGRGTIAVQLRRIKRVACRLKLEAAISRNADDQQRQVQCWCAVVYSFFVILHIT